MDVFYFHLVLEPWVNPPYMFSCNIFSNVLLFLQPPLSVHMTYQFAEGHSFS